MNPLKRFVALPPFTRFVWGFTATLLVSLTWPATLYFAVRQCADGDEYFRSILNNEQTYTTAHHLLFAPAVGLFLATLSPVVFDSVKRWSIAALVFLMAVATALAYEDVFFGPVGSYQLRDACPYLENEFALRARFAEPDANFPSDVKAFQDSKTTAGPVDTVSRLNANGVVSGLLTWIFLLFPAVFIWYSFSTAFSTSIVIRQHVQLIIVALLLICWIPLRVYTDWFTNHWHSTNWTDAPVVFGVIVALIMVVFYSVTALHWYVKNDAIKTISGIGAAIAAFVAFLLAVIPKWAPQVHKWIDKLTLWQILAAIIVGAMATLVLAYLVLGRGELSEQSDAP